MKLIGNKIFERDESGNLLSRIGTMFFRTPGLVTTRAIHAMQRIEWISSVNEDRAAAGLAPLTEQEEDEEIEQSVDLVFTDTLVLIRPDPDRMDLALRADVELQKIVPKRLIRYLNTSSSKVRQALCECGENWRMARHPISPDDMSELIERSRVAISALPIYYYNRSTGTRYITASGYEAVAALPPAEYRSMVREVLAGLSKRNRLGHPEIDVFPTSTPIEIKKGFQTLDANALSDAELRRAVDKIDTDWRMSLSPELREEKIDNFDWRNAMCETITREPNVTSTEEQELISGIAPEFYRQIEWLPGARIERGELIFDSVYEAAQDGDAESAALCDNRVKSLIFNLKRLYGSIEFINVGRIAHSLARRPVEGNRRGDVYIVQYREAGEKCPSVMMMRLQKWGVAERLDEGKDLLQAMVESDEYTDYILDRRLMCLQLGMNLPPHIGAGRFTERYRGDNAYNGASVSVAYFIRPYVSGVASDKIPPAKFHNPAFALAFARLMGEAAALDLIVGRRSSVTRERFFDRNYEVFQLDANGLPERLSITDHAGSFVEYDVPYENVVADYAYVMLRRKAWVADYSLFVRTYVDAFARRFAEVQAAYANRRAAFDGLFKDRPFDAKGSGAYRWTKALERLAAADVKMVADKLSGACGC